MNEATDNYFNKMFKDYIQKRDQFEYIKYHQLINDYVKLLFLVQDHENKVKEYSNINTEALTKITEGLVSSREILESNRLEELTTENRILKEKYEILQTNYQQTKEQLVIVTTKYEIMSEDLDQLKHDNDELKQQLTTEKKSAQQLNDEHQVLQSVLIAHEREIFNLKEENEHLLTELLKIKDKNINEILADNEAKKKFVKSTGITTTSSNSTNISKINNNLCDRICSQCPTRIIKKTNLNDDIYSIKATSLYSAVSSGNNVVLYKLKNEWNFFGILKGCSGVINCIDINPQNTQLLTGSSDHSCRIWDIEKCRMVDCLMGHEDKVLASKFSPHDSTKIISGGRDRNIKQWDIVSLSCIYTYYIPSSCIDLVAISSNSGISAHMDKNCRIWDLRINHLENSVTIPDRITSLAYANNSFVVSSRNNKLYYYDIRQLKPIILSHNYFTVPFDWSKISISPDGQYVVCGSRTSQLFIWNLNKQGTTTILEGHKYPIVCGTWSDDGCNVLSADSRRHLHFWG